MTSNQRHMFRFLRRLTVASMEDTIRSCLVDRHCPVNGAYYRRWAGIHIRTTRILRRFHASSLVQQYRYVIALYS